MHLGYCNRPPISFCNVYIFSNPKRKIVSKFLIKKHLSNSRKTIEEQQIVPTASNSVNWKKTRV